MSRSLGSLYVSAKGSRFRVMRTFYVNGERKQESVKRTAWAALGFSDSMSLEQARARAAQLNASNAVQRHELQKVAGIAARVERDRLAHSAFIPDDLNTQFLQWLEVNTAGSEDYIEKCKIIWGTAKKTVITLRLLPEHFAANKKQIFRYLATRQYSGDYVRKLISILNQYGRFCARLTGRYYEPIPSPRGTEKEMINDAYRESKRYRGPSDPLEPEVLAGLKDKIPDANFNWLFVSLWFGLRPIEVTMVMKDRNMRYWRLEEGPTDVLWVYQSKLRSVPEPDRWKQIPIKYPEQREALAMIFKGGARAPLVKTLQNVTGNPAINLYGGRKAFTDVMLERGEPLDAASAWMGHQSIERTWTKYKNKRTVHLGIVK
jgi:integrase